MLEKSLPLALNLVAFRPRLIQSIYLFSWIIGSGIIEFFEAVQRGRLLFQLLKHRLYLCEMLIEGL